jgi:hypothetical protein
MAQGTLTYKLSAEIIELPSLCEILIGATATLTLSLCLSVSLTGEEIVSGAQRIHDVALLTERAEHWKVPISPPCSYVTLLSALLCSASSIYRLNFLLNLSLTPLYSILNPLLDPAFLAYF